MYLILRAARLDRVYVTSSLQTAVVDCQAVDPPSYALGISDHRPVVVALEVKDRLFSDETARASLCNRLAASIGGHSWDALKQAWRDICTDEGKKLKHRYSGLGVMPSLITSWQSCSVVGRNVQTLNMLNRDIIDYTRQRQARGWLTSLDQAQAFDRRGGWNIPSAVVLADTYALKTTLRVLQLPEEHPARKLATYFLGVQSRLFLQTQAPGPKAINPTPFYRHVNGIYKRIAQLNLDTPLLECQNTELAQELLVNSGCEAKNPGFPWDVVWRFGWSVLPTADRMYEWHYVRSEQCVHCQKHEDNKHALITCRVAKVFWSLVDKAYHPLGAESTTDTPCFPATFLVVAHNFSLSGYAPPALLFHSAGANRGGHG
ncbi:hypothetical protein HPB52_023165 [Rhipicephalus sanguineus]|uniref:Reverse transcriptase zinc-binding domain-containing protein n=1 Tax=Rhipicephalus sanguineus TaxID=34632 RepID=A0A9D4SZS9_RHISA|nr:hypothetical protein HPB52_023165 [Rhipicephalus sanguineus]